MASLPPERLQTAAPFEFAALDLFGPVNVKEGAQGRGRFKCWVTLFVCLASRAVAMFSCPGYDTHTFMLTYTKFTSTYGTPKKCYSDHGPQITAGVTGPDWEVSRRGTKAGTEWVFTAKGCSWRNGSAERGIRMARHTLMQILLKGEVLDTHKLEALLARASFLINNRPLNVRRTGSEEYYSITANDFLLGRAARSPADLERLELGEEETAVEGMVSQQEELARAWWTSWVSKCFPDLMPRTKWKTKYRNLKEGDICHIKYAYKHAAPAYRLCKVSRVRPRRNSPHSPSLHETSAAGRRQQDHLCQQKTADPGGGDTTPGSDSASGGAAGAEPTQGEGRGAEPGGGGTSPASSSASEGAAGAEPIQGEDRGAEPGGGGASPADREEDPA